MTDVPDLSPLSDPGGPRTVEILPWRFVTRLHGRLLCWVVDGYTHIVATPN